MSAYRRGPICCKMLILDSKVEETGQKNTVLTLYELTESEATLSQGRSFCFFGGGGMNYATDYW
jgi:ESCRT-II complex subunit